MSKLTLVIFRIKLYSCIPQPAKKLKKKMKPCSNCVHILVSIPGPTVVSIDYFLYVIFSQNHITHFVKDSKGTFTMRLYMPILFFFFGTSSNASNFYVYLFKRFLSKKDLLCYFFLTVLLCLIIMLKFLNK